ncbi:MULTISPECIES: Mu-like prophage major head subunit gpT family protein [Burkholderia]|uniref:Mu-like prophage major head subunit gpT family protein n=1 Tax=Burkholderia TaxID=32008 RepID=UPI00054EDFE1|nr:MULTISPECIES: Mu-like prophage major head subunit gpT family protein [Burkholderia]AOJ13156.1 head protein [Burkholderia vietnamiensis]MCA8194107.1 Mu-like prophage major head subunit gpT family protein [Burkholderia vietnamiensis]TCT31947.1 Mu-like prophage major head subunit gpT [Burkholderia vietnamiensis]SCZ28178.1 Mu-like prophage major head subunit gpT [Burkholderia vietnamiensis]SFX63255.1 Mu-like prophage major head subunit gpT [Burkholderia vietnamiensis]
MLINAETLQAIFWTLKTTYNNAFDAAPSVWERVAMKVPSSSRENIYAWLDRFPRMRKWIGEKDVKALAAHGYTVVNDDWEATVEVDRNDIEDDNLGIYAPQAQSAGFSAKQLPDEIVVDLLNNGFTNACYDGQAFFSQAHIVRGQAVANLSHLPLTIAGQAAAMKTYGVMRTAMRKITDEDGRPLNVVPDVLMVPPALEDIANALMKNERLNDGMPNPYRGTAEVVCDARLTSDTAWYLLDTTKPVRPLVYQERKAPVFVQQTDPEADDVFMRKKFKFGAEARAAGGYGFWQLAAGSDGTAAVPQ